MFEWMPPRAKNIDIQNQPVTGVDFVITLPNIDFTVTVEDTDGNAIPKAHVYAYSPSGDSMGLYGDTDSYGSVAFKVKAGTYVYGAYVDGLPPPPESTITISTTASGTLTIALPTTTIAGTVTKNGEEPLSNVNIYAFESSKHLYRNAMTDSAGQYRIYVEDGTWQIGGWVPSFGPLSETAVTIAGSSENNIDFSVDTSGFNTIAGSVNLDSSSGTGITGVNIYAEPSNGDFTK